MEKEDMGILNIFKTIFANKWVAPITALVVAVICTLTIHFGYFLKKSEYSVSFSVVSDKEFSMALFSYDDGTSFYADNYVSSNILNEVNTAFSGIDIGTIISQKEAKIEDKYSTLGYGSVETNSELPMVKQLKITMPAKYFSSFGQACDFFNALVYYPTNKYESIDADYKIYLDDNIFSGVLTYNEQIDIIESQISYIQSGYSSLHTQAEDKINVDKAGNKFNYWVKLMNLETLRAEATANKYLKNLQVSLEQYEYELEDLKKQLIDAKKDLEFFEKHNSAQETPANSFNITSELAKLKSKITSFERSISNIYEYIDAYYDVNVPQDLTADLVYNLDADNNKILDLEHVQKTEAYGKKIQSIYDQLKGDGEVDYIKEYSQIKKRIAVDIAKNNIRSVVYKKEDTPIIVSAIIGVFFGIIVGCFAGFFVGVKKKKSM